MIAEIEGAPLALLRSIWLFDDVPPEELAMVAAHLALARFAAGETILREGEAADSCSLIQDGQAAVVSRDLIGRETTLAVLGPGQIVGEMALVRGGVRTATLRATTEVVTYRLSRNDFDRLVAVCPVFADRIQQHVDRRDVEAFLRKASIFGRLPDVAIGELAGRLQSESQRAGETIIGEGDAGDRFYLVRSGRVEVLQGGRRVGVLEAGDFFGEIALLMDVPRTATVRALEDCQLLALARPDFDQIVQEHAGLRAQFGELLRIRYRGAPNQPLVVPDPITTVMPFLQAHQWRRYWLLLLSGLALFGGLSYQVTMAPQPVWMYAALVVGAFLGPVLYAAYLAEGHILPERSWTIALVFVLAAGLGVPATFLLEQRLGATAGELGPALTIGLIEEAVKVLCVIWLLGRRSARFEMDGLVFGAAAGTGFAALENVLYGLSQMQSADALLFTLWTRTLGTPLLHGTWTAIVCATIWRTRSRARWDFWALGAFVLVVVLHGLWDWRPLPAVFTGLWVLANLAISLFALRLVIQQGTAEELGSILALNPEVAKTKSGPRLRCRGCGLEAPPGAHYCVRCSHALRR